MHESVNEAVKGKVMIRSHKIFPASETIIIFNTLFKELETKSSEQERQKDRWVASRDLPVAILHMLINDCAGSGQAAVHNAQNRAVEVSLLSRRKRIGRLIKSHI